MQEFIISTEKDLVKPAEFLMQKLKGGNNIITLEGELGAGKTSFVKKILELLKSQDEASSPTYSIINEYHYSQGILYHMDLYRLNSIEEALDIGIEEYLGSGNLCFIEWHDLIKEILPEDTINIKIDVLEDEARKILISNL